MSWWKDKSNDISVVPQVQASTQEITISQNSLFREWGYSLQYMASQTSIGEEDLQYLIAILDMNLAKLFPKNEEFMTQDKPDIKRSKNCSVMLRIANYGKTVYICLEKPQIKKMPDSRPKRVEKPDFAPWVKEFGENWAKFDRARAEEWLGSPRLQQEKYKETHNGQDAYVTTTEPFERQFLVVEGVFFFNVAPDLRDEFTKSGFVNEWPISLEIEIKANQHIQSAMNEAAIKICKLIADKNGEIKKLGDYAGQAIIENNETTALLAKELGAKKTLEVLANTLGAVQQAVKNAAEDLEGKTQENAAKRITAIGPEVAKKIAV